MRVYLVVAVWPSTKANHAGMYYLAKRLKNDWDIEATVIAIPTRGIRKLPWVYSAIHWAVGFYLRMVAGSDDKVLLMEYLYPGYGQQQIAKMLKGRVKVFGLAHLVPARIESSFTDEEIRRQVDLVDAMLVLGSSLRDYFVSKDSGNSKIRVTYHYADTNYYSPGEKLSGADSQMRVLCMGNMERSYKTLLEIVKRCDNLDFDICVGGADVGHLFADCQNVTIHGYLDEADLLQLMRQDDVSLNVMRDTIGSNVITTSLSTGLIVVASRVGSIEDYVRDRSNGLLAENTDQFVEILNELKVNVELKTMIRKNAIESAQELSIENYRDWLSSFFAEYPRCSADGNKSRQRH